MTRLFCLMNDFFKSLFDSQKPVDLQNVNKIQELCNTKINIDTFTDIKISSIERAADTTFSGSFWNSIKGIFSWFWSPSPSKGNSEVNKEEVPKAETSPSPVSPDNSNLNLQSDNLKMYEKEEVPITEYEWTGIEG